jgi:hypothetical protein
VQTFELTCSSPTLHLLQTECFCAFGVGVRIPYQPHPLLIHASPSTSISLSSSTASSLPFLSLLYSFNMPIISNLHMSLCRRCAVPTSPPLPYASLRRHRHARIERIPLVACRTSFTTPSSTKLVVSGELKSFPLSKSNFSDIRGLPGSAYFDKTEYISKLQGGTDVQLFCRPTRFGKSLTVTMLRNFHGFQFRKQYDKLFKVCGCGLFLEQNFHAHITYAKVRVSTWIKMSKMA